MKALFYLILLGVGVLFPSQNPGPSVTGSQAGVIAGCVNAPVCPCVIVGSTQREFCTSSVSWSATTNGSNITVEAIGGGGGGYFDGSGSSTSGGGGGEYASSSIAYTSLTTVTVTVGARGAGATTSSGSATSGGNSSF